MVSELMRTGRVVLRRWAAEDAAAFLSIYGRDEVAEWLGEHPRRLVRSIPESQARIARWHYQEAGLAAPLGFWAIIEAAGSGAPIGTVLLLPLHAEHGETAEVEIGWHLHPDRQRLGLATAAAQALLDAAAAAGLLRLLALTDRDNLPSQAVARRLGMADEGTTERWFGITTRQFAVNLAGAAPNR